MKDHSWINLPGEGNILHWWCQNCGMVRLEFCGEEEPYEYFIPGTALQKRNDYYIGETLDPGCKKKFIDES